MFFVDIEGNTDNSINVPQRVVHIENDLPEEKKERRPKTRATSRKSKCFEVLYF